MLTLDIDIGILSVRPSICLSRSGIVSKRLNISLYFLQLMIPNDSGFPGTIHLGKISYGGVEYRWGI